MNSTPTLFQSWIKSYAMYAFRNIAPSFLYNLSSSFFFIIEGCNLWSGLSCLLTFLVYSSKFMRAAFVAFSFCEYLGRGECYHIFPNWKWIKTLYLMKTFFFMCFFSNTCDTCFGFYFMVFFLTKISQDLLSFQKLEIL